MIFIYVHNPIFVTFIINPLTELNPSEQHYPPEFFAGYLKF